MKRILKQIHLCKQILKDIALYIVAFIFVLAGAIFAFTDEIGYNIYIKAIILGIAVWCGFKINTYREKILNKDKIDQNKFYKYNSYFLTKLSDRLILVDQRYVFEYIKYKRSGEKSGWCPFTFEEDGLLSDVRDLIDEAIEEGKKDKDERTKTHI
jgi:hypothetical protein